MRPTRREVLWGSAAGLLAAPRAWAAATGARNLVIVVADGGWDLTYAFDPKPGISSVDGPYVDLDPRIPDDIEQIGTYGEIDVTLNNRRRPQVTQFFETWGHRATVIRGLWVGSVSHWIGRKRILSGLDDLDAPDMGTITGLHLGGDRPLGVVDLSGIGRLGDHSALAIRGGQRAQLAQLLDPGARDPLGDGSPRRGLLPTSAERGRIDAWLAERAVGDRLARATDAGRSQALDDRGEARRRAEALLSQSGHLALPDSGSRNLDADVTFAVSLLGSQTCRAVLVDAAGGSWDTHLNHVNQHGNHDQLFGGLTLLLDELELAGILEDTLVVAMSEMARSPRRNAYGGTEHWPYTGMLLAGGGVAGGRVLGGTDGDIVGQPVDLETGRVDPAGEILRYDQVVAAILDHVGVEIGEVLPGVRPLRGFSTS